MMKRLVLSVIALAVGCGPSYRNAFSYHFADNRTEDLRLILDRLPEASHDDRPENALGQPIAVATTHAESDAERQLVAMNVESGEQMWSATVDAATRPEILGDVVMVSTREALMAFDLRSGQRLWSYDLPDLAYVGATRDGDKIFWSATVGALGGARRVGHVVAMDARSGAELWRHEIEGVFGQPAAQGGYVFVPWERQNIAVLDQLTGDEMARLRSTDDVIAWAFDHPTGIYYGGRGIYRLTHRSASGERAESTHIRPALGELPRQPESIWPDGFVPEPGTRSARGRIRVYFNPAPAPDAESIQIEGDAYYFVYYRYVFAYDLDGQLMWTRILQQDVIGAEAMPHGLLTVGEQGQMHLLDRDSGNDRWARDADTALASVALDAAGFDPGGAPSEEPRPLRTSLNEMVLDPDNRLVAARAYAIGQLSRIENEEITRDLLDLYQQRSMPGALKEAIREALRTRRSGAPHLMAALERRYDYLEDTEAPPLEAIVPALLEMEHAEAVPRLVAHMMDHETPADVLPQVVRAVVELGQADAVPALTTFLTLYQADSEFAGPVTDQPPAQEGEQPVRADPEARALAIAAEGIFRFGGEEGRALLTSLRPDAVRTHDAISGHIASLFEAETRAAEEAEQAEAQEAERARRVAAAEAEAALPRQLSQDAINATFAENADVIRECIAGELERNPLLTQVRMVFILTREGQTSELTVNPATEELQQCLATQLAEIEFPRFRQRMMRATFAVSIRGGEQPEESTEPAIAQLPDDAPWWAWNRIRARTTAGGAPPVPAVAAWWTERDPPVVAVAPTAPAVDENELPPGMVVQPGTQPQPRTQPQPTPTPPNQTGQAGSWSRPPPDDGAADPAWTRPTQTDDEPSEPAPPAQRPTQPTQPAQARPSQPTQPAQPSQPTQPAQPSQPAQPAPPAGGGTPWWAGAADDEEEESD